MNTASKHRSLIASLGSLLLISFLSLSCATNFGGKIEDSVTQKPIETEDGKINVVRLDESGKQTSETFATSLSIVSGGRFHAEETLEPGTYLVEAVIPGYELYSERVTITDEQKALDIELIPIAETTPSSIGTHEGAQEAKGSGSVSLTPPNM